MRRTTRYSCEFAQALLACSVVSFCSISHAGTAIITPTTEQVELSSYISMLEDPGGTLTAHTITSSSNTLDWVGSLNSTPNLGFTDSVWWFRLNLKNQSQRREWIMVLGYTQLDKVDLITTQGDQLEIVQSGDLRPASSRYRDFSKINFRITIEPEEHKTYWLRVSTSSSLQLPITIYSELAFGDAAAKESSKNSFLYGIFVVMIIINTLLFLNLRDPNYLPYLLYLTTFLMTLSTLNGTTGQTLLPNLPELANLLLPASVALAFVGALLFSRNFLSCAWRMPRLTTAMDVFTGIFILLAALSFVAPYRTVMLPTVVLGVFVPLMIIAAGIAAYRDGLGPARTFLLAWTAFLAGVLLYLLKTLGALPSSFITDQSIQIGSALQVTLLTIALADRVRVLQEDRRQSSRALSATRAKLNEELEARLQLFSGIAHQLNNPLNYIVLGVSSLDEHLSKLNKMLAGLLHSAEESESGRAIKQQFDETFSSAESAFQNVIEGCGRAARTVEEMRGLSGIDGEAHWEFALWELVEEAQKRVESDIGTSVCRNVGWESHIDRSSSDRVEGNPFVLIQAVANLLENAIQYSEDDNPVRVELPDQRSGNTKMVDFVIRNKCAIAAEHHERIFQMGFSTAGRRGTGLNVARSMLREQGGKLELIDDGRNSGWVSFKVTLPTVSEGLGHAA